MSSQASVLKVTQAKLEHMKAAFKTDENKQKSKPAPRTQIKELKETTKKAVKRPAVDKLVEPVAKRTVKTVQDCVNVNPTKNITISAARINSNVKLLRVAENKKSVREGSQPKIISSLVDNIINEMDDKNRSLTKNQIRHIKPVVKITATPKTTSFAKHVSWTEADLENFGFVFFSGI